MSTGEAAVVAVVTAVTVLAAASLTSRALAHLGEAQTLHIIRTWPGHKDSVGRTSGNGSSPQQATRKAGHTGETCQAFRSRLAYCPFGS